MLTQNSKESVEENSVDTVGLVQEVVLPKVLGNNSKPFSMPENKETRISN